MAYTLNAIAKHDFRASCGHAIRAGERLSMRRERAVSYRAADMAGSAYPWRKRCAACVETLNAQAEQGLRARAEREAEEAEARNDSLIHTNIG